MALRNFHALKVARIKFQTAAIIFLDFVFLLSRPLFSVASLFRFSGVSELISLVEDALKIQQLVSPLLFFSSKKTLHDSKNSVRTWCARSKTFLLFSIQRAAFLLLGPASTTFSSSKILRISFSSSWSSSTMPCRWVFFLTLRTYTMRRCVTKKDVCERRKCS